MTDAPSQSLYLVSNELASTLDDARHSLEDYAEGNAGRESLAKCSELIHLVRGALRIVEVYGAALLAEEMEYTLDHLLQSNSGQVNEDGVEALSRSMVQLPAYLDQLQTGGRDIALVLLPLLNDLRAVRGKPLLSEGTLLLLNIAPDRDAGPKIDRRLSPPGGNDGRLQSHAPPATDVRISRPADRPGTPACPRLSRFE